MLRQALTELRLKAAVFFHGTPLAADATWLELTRAEAAAQRRHGRVNDIRKAKSERLHAALAKGEGGR